MLLIVILFGALAFTWLQAYLFRHNWNKHLSVKLSVLHETCEAGEENVLTEVITNGKWLPLPMLHVKFNTPKSFCFENEENSSVTDYYYRDDIFAIMGHESVTRQLKFVCESRGCFALQDTNITSTDLFMNLTLTDRRSNPIVIHVYPKKMNVGFFNIPFQTITGNFVTQQHLVEDPFEFRGIREYQPYDSMHNINWKSSAKNQQLQVNTYFMTASQEVRIIFNIETHLYSKDHKLVEGLISLVSSLAEKLIAAGIPVALNSNAFDIFTKEPLKRDSGSGIAHMVSIDTALARVDAYGEHQDFVKLLEQEYQTATNKTYYLIISNNHHEEVLKSYQAFYEVSPNSYFIIPEFAHHNVAITMPNVMKFDIY